MTRLASRARGRDGRLRTSVRILGFIAAFYVLGLAATLLNRFALRPLALPVPWAIALRGLVIAIVATLAVGWARVRLDRRTITSLGLAPRFAVRDVVAGLAFSAVFVSLVVNALRALGAADIAPTHASASSILLVTIGSAITVGWWEELVFRGYLYQNLEDELGVVPAMVASVVLYGVVHALNPHATAGSLVVVSAIGLSRLAGYLCTRALWLSIGMHAGWNAFQGAVFGLPTSGRDAVSIWDTRISAPVWISGGDFGIEGSALGLTYALAGIIAIRGWTRHRAGVRAA